LKKKHSPWLSTIQKPSGENKNLSRFNKRTKPNDLDSLRAKQDAGNADIDSIRARQDEGNTLYPGSTPAKWEDYKATYSYSITLHKNPRKINSTWENKNKNKKTWSDLEGTINRFEVLAIWRFQSIEQEHEKIKGKHRFFGRRIKDIIMKKRRTQIKTDIYIRGVEKRQRNTMQKEQRKKEEKVMLMNECSTCRNDFY